VPMLLRWPGTIPAGASLPFASVVDVAATVVAAALHQQLPRRPVGAEDAAVDFLRKCRAQVLDVANDFYKYSPSGCGWNGKLPFGISFSLFADIIMKMTCRFLMKQ
jgi:arylsulfatase A-like enzyme